MGDNHTASIENLLGKSDQTRPHFGLAGQGDWLVLENRCRACSPLGNRACSQVVYLG